MDKYYVNKRAEKTGEHEVHKAGCVVFPVNYIYLGEFTTCQEAVTAAKAHYTNVDGCYYCIPKCHTR